MDTSGYLHLWRYHTSVNLDECLLKRTQLSKWLLHHYWWSNKIFHQQHWAQVSGLLAAPNYDSTLLQACSYIKFRSYNGMSQSSHPGFCAVKSLSLAMCKFVWTHPPQCGLALCTIPLSSCESFRPLPHGLNLACRSLFCWPVPCPTVRPTSEDHAHPLQSQSRSMHHSFPIVQWASCSLPFLSVMKMLHPDCPEASYSSLSIKTYLPRTLETAGLFVWLVVCFKDLDFCHTLCR